MLLHISAIFNHKYVIMTWPPAWPLLDSTAYSSRGDILTVTNLLETQVHWTTIFTDRLSDTVKLVGPTISCEGTVFTMDSSPH